MVPTQHNDIHQVLTELIRNDMNKALEFSRYDEALKLGPTKQDFLIFNPEIIGINMPLIISQQPTEGERQNGRNSKII